MFKTHIPRMSYFSESVYKAEIENVFRKVWLLVGTAKMIPNNLDYHASTIAGVSLFIQNFDGEIKCFENVCRHRMARLQTEESGNGPISCPYHGWRYSSSGDLIGIPQNTRHFQCAPDEMSKLSLREFRIARIGNLLFVNLDENPIPIDSQFSVDQLSLMSEMTEEMDAGYIDTKDTWNFNWKLGVENIKDPVHAPHLHSTTFPSNIDFLKQQPILQNSKGAEGGELAFHQSTTTTDVVMNPPTSHDWFQNVKALEPSDTYRCLRLFPNVNLMIISGRSYSIQTYKPVSATQTEVSIRIFLTKSVQPFAHKPLVLWEHLKDDMNVLKQDIDCLTMLQAGMEGSVHEQIHGQYESEILNFHRAYNSLMEGSHE